MKNIATYKVVSGVVPGRAPGVVPGEAPRVAYVWVALVAIEL